MISRRKHQPIRLPGLKPGVWLRRELSRTLRVDTAPRWTQCPELAEGSRASYPDLKIGVCRSRTYQFGFVLILIIFFLFGSFVRGSLAMTTEEEKKLGKEVLLGIKKEVDFVRDLNTQAFIEKVGYSIVDRVGPTPFEFKFYVINAPDPNAFAVPGGYIFVNTGLIVLAENEQELAGVLSHEIAHVTQRHVAQMIEKSKRLNIASMVAILATMLAGKGGAGSQAGAAMARATVGALELKYTREIEADADLNGLHYMVKAGYDPNGMINFFKRIQKVSLEMAPNIPAYLLDHPALEDRISLLENILLMEPKSTGPFKTFGNFNRIRTVAFVEEREPHVAISHFQSMVDANSQDLDGYYGLGLAYKKVGRLDKSTEVFQTGLSLSSKDPELLRELGIVYFLSGKLEQAIEKLEAVRSSSSAGAGQNDDLLALYYLGRAYQEKGDFANALPLFLKVKREMPEYIDVYFSLGSVYGRMGQKGLSHFYFAKHFKLRGEMKNALLHFRTALEWLERGSPERDEAQREIRELTQTK
jgi:predicted Zn-dependent protease